jgi:cytochrome c
MKKTFLTLAILLIPALNAQSQDPSAISTGAELWAANCTRCHSARSPMERTASEWKTIVNHMRVRANLTKSEAFAISAYFDALAPKTASLDIQSEGRGIFVPTHTSFVPFIAHKQLQFASTKSVAEDHTTNATNESNE